MCKIGGVSPICEVWRRKYTDHEVLSIGNDRYPSVRGRVPKDLGITELGAVDGNHRIARVFRKRVATICRIGDLLGFFLRSIQGIHRNHAIGLIRKEAAGVVHVDNSRA